MDLYEKDNRGRRRAKNAGGNRDVQYYDHVWVLFDTDVPARQGQLNPAMELAENEGIHIGHSTPCVEVWLLLHFRDRPGVLLDNDAAVRELRKWSQEYEKTKAFFPKLWKALSPNIPTAVARGSQVRKYHHDAATPFPPNPSSELDLLVCALNASVQPQLRILL
jgi:hypothetical protein